MFKIFNLGIEFIYKINIDDKVLGYKNNKDLLHHGTKQYAAISDSIDRYNKEIPGEVKDSPKRFGRTIKNMFVNAIDNSVGYFASSWQNYQTKRALKKGDYKPIVYTIHGRVQNKGAHWRMGKELKKEGFHVYHLKGNHGLGDVNKSKERAYAQIDKLYKSSGTKPSSTRAYISGHSSGADLGVAIANDDKAHDYGIKAVQSRAGLPYGIKKTNLYTKALGKLINIKGDLKTTPEGKAKMAKNYFTDSRIPIYASVGKYDRLVNPKDAYHRSAKTFDVLDHKDAGHFGTSGQHKQLNKYFINQIKNLDKKYELKTDQEHKYAA